MPASSPAYPTFAHLTATKSDSYRLVLATLYRLREAYVLQLRPTEIAEALCESPREPKATPTPAPPNETQLLALLQQLHTWGNLEVTADRVNATTIEAFQKIGFLYSLSPAGLATEQALDHFRQRLGDEGSLDRRVLRRIREQLAALDQQLADRAPRDVGFRFGAARDAFDRLAEGFDALAHEGKAFVLNLRSALELQKLDLQAFLGYKQWLLGYLQDFVTELTATTHEVLDTLDRIDPARADQLLERLAADDAEHAPRPGPEVLADCLARRRARWSGVQTYFRATPGRVAPAEQLRHQAQAAIPQLLRAVRGLSDRHVRRADRGADLRTLARWFLDAPDDDHAHALWRGVTGLHAARHLHVDGDTLDARERKPVPAATPWADAPPLELPIRLRQTGTLTTRGRGTKVTDRRAARARLRARAAEQTRQLQAARRELLTDGPRPLAHYAALSPLAFDELFDLLAAALARRRAGAVPIDTDSLDGRLTLRLGPPAGPEWVELHTPRGRLTTENFTVDIQTVGRPEPAA